MPEDKMPEVTMDDTFTPATYNDPDFAIEMGKLFAERFGDDKVFEAPAVMGGEDFSRYRRADPENITSLIFWVGGVPQDAYDKSKAEGTDLPSLHSPFWAPDAEKTVAAASEAMTAATLEIMAKP